jgi:hypothetical protein
VSGGRRRPTATRRGQGRQGFALLVALLVVFLLSVALSLIALSLAVRLRVAREEARAATLTALCDAALAETLPRVAAAAPRGGVTGVGAHPFGSGTIGSQVQKLSPTYYRITATARFEGKGRTVVADVVRDLSGTRVVHWLRLSG